MELTSSDQQPFRFSSSREIKADAAVLVCLALSCLKKIWYKCSHSSSQHGLQLLLRPRGIDIFAAAKMVLQKFWYASSTQLESGSGSSSESLL